MRLGKLFSVLAVAVSAALPAMAQQKNGENAITAPVGGQIPAGQNLEIKWNPTTKGTVSLVLIKGAPGALQEVLPIIANHPNNGAFSWAPPKDLQGMQTMGADQGYGIKVIDDETKNFNEGALFKLDNADSTFAGGAAESKPPGEATTPPAGETAPPAAQTSGPAEPATTPETAPPAPPTTEATPATEPAAPTTAADVPPTTLETAVASTPVASDPAAATSADSTSSGTSASSTADSDSAKSSETSSATATPTPAKKIGTATIIGIAAAVVVFVVAAIVGVILLMRRRKVNRESKMFGGNADPLNLRNSGYKPQTSYDSEFAMMERQRPYAEFRETGPYSSHNAPPQPEHIGMARI